MPVVGGGDLRLRLNMRSQLHPVAAVHLRLPTPSFGYAASGCGTRVPGVQNFFGGGSARCAASSRVARPDRRHQRLHRAARAASTSTTSSTCPCQGTGNDRRLRLFFLLDIGNVWGSTADRSTACAHPGGIGMNWLSPVGPLKMSYAVPIQQKPGDRIPTTMIQIGTAILTMNGTKRS